jgi:hypothetical protein
MTPRQRLAAFLSGHPENASGPAPALDLGGPLGSLPQPIHRLVRRRLSLPETGGSGRGGEGAGGSDPLLRRLGLAAPEDDLLDRFGVDTAWAAIDGPGTPPKARPDGGSAWLDAWGAGLERPPGAAAYRPAWAPLAKATGPSDFKNHRFPLFNGADDERWGLAAERAAASGGRALCLVLRGVLEVAGDLLGWGRLAADLGRGGAMASEVAARVAEVQLRGCGRLASVLGPGGFAAVVVTVEGPGEGPPDFPAAQAALFRPQAMIVGTLARLGLAPVALFGRSPDSVGVLGDLGGAAVIAPRLIGACDPAGPGADPPPGSAHRPPPAGPIWSGPAGALLGPGDPEALGRRAAEAYGRWLAIWPFGPLSPWLAAGPDADPAGLAAALEAAAAIRR